MFALTTLTSGPNVAVYPPGATFGPRNLRDYEFVWLLEGHARYRFCPLAGENRVPETETVPETEISLVPGQLLLCHPHTRDGFVWDEKSRTRHGFFHFRLHRAPPEWGAPHAWPHVVTLRENEILAPLCRHILSLSETDAVQKNLAASLLLSAFVTGKMQIGDAPAQKLPEPVERALSWIYQRLDEDAGAPIPLESLAKIAFVTPEHLCRLFRNSTGHAPLETVRLARLDRAAMLLSRSNYSIGEVARMTGFASPFHFSRAFKEVHGDSPREWSKKVANGEISWAPQLLRTLRPNPEKTETRE